MYPLCLHRIRAQVRVAVAQIFCAGRGPLENLDGSPLALSQFSRRAAMRPCENWSAAPSTPRCIVRWTRFGVLAPTPARLFLPQAAPRLRCQTQRERGKVRNHLSPYKERPEWTVPSEKLFGYFLDYVVVCIVPGRSPDLT